MTRKDYQLIADAITKHQGRRIPITVYVVILDIADALAADNPRFDRERFLKACGIE